ncbi:MAG: OmpH family outer membrane protein [bacterium]
MMQIAEDLRNNPLLTPKAKQEKEQELQNRQRILREKVRQFEQELRLEERKLTEAIFQDLKAAIRTVSQRSDYDLVLEKNAAQVILYMKEETTDLTQKIIDYYNSLKHQNSE